MTLKKLYEQLNVEKIYINNTEVATVDLDGTTSSIFKIDSTGIGPLFKNVSGHLEIRTFDDSGVCDTTLGTLTSNTVYADSIKNKNTDDFEVYLDTRNESFTETSLLRITGTDSTISGGGFIETFINGVDPVTLEEYSLFGRQSAQHKKSYIVLSSPYGGVKLETSNAESASLNLYDVATSNELIAFPSYITISGNTVWHAGNDGIGSGLDADLLDGYNSTYFTPTSTTINNHALSSNITLTGDDFDIPQIGSPTYNTLTEYINGVGFTGRITGGIISDGGSGTVNITSGSGLIRTTNSPYGVIKSFDWPTYTSVALTDNSINYICISYNSGSPNIYVTTDRNAITWTDVFPLGRVFRSGTTLNFVNSGIEISNFAGRVHDRDIQVDGFKHVSGAVVSSPSGLKIATTSGIFYIGINPVSTVSKNTNVSDTFTYWYRNGSGGWTTSTGNTDITPGLYDDGDGTLGTVSNNKYSVHFVYIMYDGALHVQYGQSGSYTLSEAEAATIPSPPPVLASFGILCAKIITAYNGTTPYAIQSSWDVAFAGSAPTNHAGLTNLDYSNAGHTGFSPDTHTHNGVYIRYLGESSTVPATYLPGDEYWDTSGEGVLKKYISYAIGWKIITTT